MRDSFETIIVEPQEHLTWITLNRPEAANAFNTQMAEELRDVFGDF
ncbi:MAG TPA: enoyl-CoA hydratase, partial [Gammaproteobacteria bacterium]|nr:enoyl-CoA hydratase [Gammaproteobacteria bacterium]